MRTTGVLLAALCLFSCSSGRERSPSPGASALRIRVFQSGKITADERETTVAALKTELRNLKARGGTVWYYREAGEQAPPREALEVIHLVADMGIPITLSSQPDFSDYVDSDGQTHPKGK